VFQRIISAGRPTAEAPVIVPDKEQFRLDGDSSAPVIVRPTTESGVDLTDLKVRIHQQLIDVMNLSAIETMKAEELQVEVDELIREQLTREQVPLNQQEKQRLTVEVLDEILGYGPLEPLLKDPTVSDIIVNTSQQVYVERAGKLEPTTVRFKDDRHLSRIINKIVAAVGRRVDESQPLCDARLADGSRVNAVVPPIGVDGPLLSIRKFSKKPFNLERLVQNQTMALEMAYFLAAAVRGRLNIVISGGTGTGKTTTLNAMSHAIAHNERIVTIEDTAELQLQQRHVARLETRPPNLEGRGEITQRDLVKNALRMRPDRIILGECRAGEAFDMLQAMNTGHDGSMCTVHANTCRDAIARLEMMVGMAGIDMPLRSVRAQIASAINVIIQLERMSDGNRRLVSIHEITGMEGDTISMQEIFHYKRISTDQQGKITGQFLATGVRPRFAADLEAKGIPLPPHYFVPDKSLGQGVKQDG
jgi:pilus assembly protein CpaF